MPPLLFLFTIANLVIGTGAFVIGGILGPIAGSLNVTVPAAGQAMTAYAMANALLAPVLLIATGKWPRKHALMLALTLFMLGNVVCAMAGDLQTLIAGRVLMGLGGMFTPVAAGIAISLVEPARRGKALATVFLGISLSYAIGVPLGAWLGFRYGWQMPVIAIAVAGAAMLALVAWRVPREIDAPGVRFAGLGQVLSRGPVWWVLVLTLSYFVAIFCVFSYIGPVLQALQPMSPVQLSMTLALFGCSGAAGTLIGGWANDRFGPHWSLRVQLSVLGSMMVLLPLAQGHYAAIVAVLVIWGAAGFGMMTPQQARLATLAPTQAPLLLSLNTSMLYFGTALGAVVGGAAVAHVGFAHLPWAGVPFVLIGLASVMVTAPRSTLRPTA